jgi:outer membrane protein OmpA-like peptidoglycan-associated protein
MPVRRMRLTADPTFRSAPMPRPTFTRLTLATGLAALAATATLAAPADAQGFGDRLKRAAKEAAARKVEERVEERASQAADAALDGAEQGARGAAKGTHTEGKTESRAESKAVSKAEGKVDGAPRSDAMATEPAAPAPARPTTNVGKDFTPGTRVVYATDFTRDEIGDFPRAFRLRRGNMEVADIGGTRYLRATSFGEFEIPLPETLPERFTMEFDFTAAGGWYQQLFLVGHEVAGDLYHASLRPTDGGLAGPDGYDVSAAVPGTKEGVPFRVQIMADGEYVKVYMNGTRVANAPNAALGRSRTVRFRVSADEDSPFLLGNLRIAAGGKDLYAALEASGRVTAEGVLFDTNSDRLRPESAPVLKEIAAMLAAHPELRLSVEGHTDDVGAPAANLALSEKRAAAVVRHLTTTLGVDAARLSSAGFGATRPVAANGSESDRQRNRRVELVKR